MIFVIIAVKAWWPEVIPFDVFEFWKIKGAPGDWLKSVWPLLAWGLGLNVAISLLWPRYAFYKYRNMDAGRFFLIGTITDIWAGVVEETCFRWILVLGAMATLTFTNFLFFGWLGFGLPKWFHLAAWGPLANWTTFGYLEPYIFHETGWAVGAAVLWANAFFREGHRYQGLIGVINSWFMGMFFFWIMFTYGLLAAILVHFTHNFLITIYVTIWKAFKKEDTFSSYF